MDVAWQRGTVVDLIPLLDQMDADTPDAPHAMAVAMKAMAHADAGQLDEARQLLSELATRDFDFPMDMTLGWPGWSSAPKPPSNAGTRGTRGPLFDHLAPWADQWSTSIRRLRPRARSATTSVDWPPFSAVTAKPRPTSPKPRPRAPERVPSSSPPARTSLGAGCSRRARALVTPKRRADCSPHAHTAAVAHGYATVQRRAAAALHVLS